MTKRRSKITILKKLPPSVKRMVKEEHRGRYLSTLKLFLHPTPENLKKRNAVYRRVSQSAKHAEIVLKKKNAVQTILSTLMRSFALLGEYDAIISAKTRRYEGRPTKVKLASFNSKEATWDELNEAIRIFKKKCLSKYFGDEEVDVWCESASGKAWKERRVVALYIGGE